MKTNEKKSALRVLPAAAAAAALLSILASVCAAPLFPESVSPLIGAAVFIPVLAFLLLGLRKVIRRLLSLEALVRPLAEKNIPALGEGGETEDGHRYAPLAESLSSLKKFFESLETYLSGNLGLEDILRNESVERDAIIDHAEKTIAGITRQFTEIESSAKQAVEALSGMEEYVLGLDAGSKEQSSVLEESGNRLSRAAEDAVTAAGKIRESALQAEDLKREIAGGEDQAREVNDIVKAISREVEGIAEMIGIINKISEQTNILSMNAAIESAHAGQAGAGFAVVADEIRKLADSTRENAARIGEELSSITVKTREALAASEASFGSFSTVMGKIAGLAAELGGIAEEASAGSAANGEIAVSIQESARARPSAVDIMVHQQSFKSSLELINRLADETRAGIKEVHSGTREIIEKVKATEERFLKSLKKTGDFKNVFLLEELSKNPAPQAVLPPPLSTPALSGPAPAPQSAEHKTLIVKTGGITAAARDISGEHYSDSREVTVKKPPAIVP